MPTTILDGETYEEARYRRFSEEAEEIEKMTQDEIIIAMAREAGLHKMIQVKHVVEKVYEIPSEKLERFAALVAARWEKIHQQEMSMMSELCADRILEEREACAKVCDEEDDGMPKNVAQKCAAAIRARSQS